MKKFIYTLSFALLTGLAVNAQNASFKPVDNPSKLKTDGGLEKTDQNGQQEPKKEVKPQENKKAAPAESAEPASPPRATRMAINEKGVPASKEPKASSNTPAAVDKNKNQKAANPGQPAGNN